MSRYCKSCNSVLIDDAIICFNCGMRCEYKITKVGTKIEVEPIEPETVKPPVKPVEYKEKITSEEKPVSEKIEETVKPVETEKHTDLGKAEESEKIVKPNPKPQQEEPKKETSETKIKKMNPILYYGLAGVGLSAFFVSIITVIVMVVAMFFTGPRIAVRNYEKAINNTDFNMTKLVPEDCWSKIGSNNYSNYEGMKNVLKQNYDSNLGLWKQSYGQNVEAKLKIRNNEKVSDNTLRKIASSLNYQYGISYYDVKKANELRLYCEISGSYGESNCVINLYAVKIENQWYMVYFDEEDNVSKFALNDTGYVGVKWDYE